MSACLGIEPAKCSVFTHVTGTPPAGVGHFCCIQRDAELGNGVNTPNLKGLHCINNFLTGVEVVYPD